MPDKPEQEYPEAKPAVAIKAPSESRQQQAADNTDFIARGLNASAPGLQELTITGDSRAEKEGNRHASDAGSSWSNKPKDEVIKYLDQIKATAESNLKAHSQGNDVKDGPKNQQATYEYLRDVVLPKLRAENRLKGDWQLYPTSSHPQPPADKIGADFLFVNKQTGEYHIIDATQKQKSPQETFVLREDGVVVVESKFLDRETSQLKLNEPGSKELADRIEQQFSSLSRKPSPFKFGHGEAPFPALTETPNKIAEAQIKDFLKWGERKIADAIAAGRLDEATKFGEMTERIKTGALGHIEALNREVRSAEMIKSVNAMVEDELAKYLLAKSKNTETATKKEPIQSNLRTSSSGEIKLDAASGEQLLAGRLAEHLALAKNSLVNPGRLCSHFSNSELKKLGLTDLSKIHNLSGEAKIAALNEAFIKLPVIHVFKQSVLMLITQRQLDVSDIKILETNIWNRLKSSTNNQLLNRNPTPAIKAEKLSGDSEVKPGEKPAEQPRTGEKSNAKTAVPAVDKLTNAAEQLATIHKGEKFDTAKANQSLGETIQLIILDQEKHPSMPDAELAEFQKLSDAYSDPTNPNHEQAVKQIHEHLNKQAESAEADAAKLTTEAAAIEKRLKGNETYERIVDEKRMQDVLKPLVERGDHIASLAKDPVAQGKFISEQLKTALRKQLGLTTNAQLPDGLKNMTVEVVNGTETKVSLGTSGKPGKIEIPASMLNSKPGEALAKAYAHVAGMGLVEVLAQKGNEGISMQSLKPMTDKIAAQAENLVKRTEVVLSSAKLAASGAKTELPSAAASDRSVKLETTKAVVTAWDGTNLSFGGEKFNVATEVVVLEKQRHEEVKTAEENAKVAKEKADKTKAAPDIAAAQELATRAETARQNLLVVQELHRALKGERGVDNLARASNLVKTAADKAISDHLSRTRELVDRAGGGATLSRAGAATMIISSLAFMYVKNAPAASASEYGTGGFH